MGKNTAAAMMMQQPGRPPPKLALPDILQALSRMLSKAQWVPVQLVLQKWKTVSDQKLPLRTGADAVVLILRKSWMTRESRKT